MRTHSFTNTYMHMCTSFMVIVYEKYTNTVNKIYILKFNRHCFRLSYSGIMGLYFQRDNKIAPSNHTKMGFFIICCIYSQDFNTDHIHIIHIQYDLVYIQL